MENMQTREEITNEIRVLVKQINEKVELLNPYFVDIYFTHMPKFVPSKNSHLTVYITETKNI